MNPMVPRWTSSGDGEADVEILLEGLRDEPRCYGGPLLAEEEGDEDQTLTACWRPTSQLDKSQS